VAGSRARAAQLGRLHGIAEEALAAGSLADMHAALPAQAAWALEGISDPAELWRAELAWWSRPERDAPALLRAWDDEPVVLAVVALLAIDAQRTVRALRAAAHGGSPDSVELFDGAA
jgi:hypothetical protein